MQDFKIALRLCKISKLRWERDIQGKLKYRNTDKYWIFIKYN